MAVGNDTSTPRGAVEAYMDVSPMAPWTMDKWDEYDATIATAFHGPDVFLTPLVNWVSMPPGSDTYYTGAELLGGHTNHNAIGNRQRYIDAMYVDGRRKRLTSAERWGGKVQLTEFDELVSQYGQGTPQFMLAVLRERLMRGIISTHEKIARDMIFDYALFKFLADGTAWSSGTADFSTLTASSSYQMQLKFVNEVKLRLIERSKKWAQQAGSWTSPIPNYPSDAMIMTTPNVLYDLWETEEGDWVQDLRQLQDDRVINGGTFRYKGATFVDNWWLTLFNAGPITKQCGVTAVINWGDGSPDPDTTLIDNVYITGQTHADLKHYVQLTDFDATDFYAGDRVSIHTARTASWGVTNGVNFLDGKTYEAEVYSVDATLNRLTFMEPFTEEYLSSFNDTTHGTIYAYVTKARHIHPILVVAARGMATFAARTKVRLHNPPDDADLPGVTRVTWDEYGGKNRWNPYVYEILFAVASDTRSGRDEVSLR